LAAITYKANKAKQFGWQAYLCNSFRYYLWARNLHSALALLQQPPANMLFSSRASPVTALAVWNSLNITTHSADIFLTFKNRLKTELFIAILTPLIYARLTLRHVIKFMLDLLS